MFFKTKFYLFLVASIFIATQNINPAAAAPPPEAFGELPRIPDAALSPDASKVAVIVFRNGQHYIRISDNARPNDKAKIIGLGDGVKPAYIKWANNSRVILSFWQSEKLGRTPIRMGYLFTLDVNSMKGKILIDPRDEGGKRMGSNVRKAGIFRQYNNIVVDWLEDEPDTILMSYSKSDNNVQPDLYRVDVSSGRDSIVKRGVEGIQYWYTDQTGQPRIGQGRNDDDRASWSMLIKDSNSGEWSDSENYPGLNANADIHGFTSDPNELIISVYRGKDTRGLYVYDLSAKSITRKIYHNNEYDATGVILSKNGEDIIGATYIADTAQTEMLGDNDTILEAMRRKYQGYIIDYVDQSQDGETVLFKVSSPYNPGAMMMVKGSTGEPQNLGAMRPNLPPETLGEVISVKYSARDGQKIPSYVTLPPTITNTAMLKGLPFIVLPHGGPYARDSKRFDYFAQFFASRGFGVLQMNFRGSEGYGLAYEQAGRKNWVVMQEDVEDGTKWLFEKGYADPNRTCIAGWSYGGYAALMGAAKNPELYKCTIAMAALTDIAGFMRDQRQYRFGEQSVKGFIGDGFKDKDDIKANSPVKIAEDMTIPLFLAHGELDQQVNFTQYKRMRKALKKSKAKVTYMEFEDEDHYLSNEDNRIKFFKGLDKFLKDTVGKSEFSP